jgi:hypothetical protein
MNSGPVEPWIFYELGVVVVFDAVTLFQSISITGLFARRWMLRNNATAYDT